MARTKQFDENEILEKAKVLFWKQGYHATSIQDLVNHLGINRASLYATFGGKNQLYEKALQAYRKEGIQYLEQQVTSSESAKESIRGLFMDLTKSNQEETPSGCFVVNCITEYLPMHPHILQDIANHKETFNTIISKALKKGIEQREFKNDLDIQATADYLFAFFSGLRVISKLQPSKEELCQSISLGLKILE